MYKEATEKAERIGRAYFDLTYPNYEKHYSTDTYDWWDVSGHTSTNTNSLRTPQPYIAEIKLRDNRLEEYQTILMEKFKYEKLLEYTKQSGIASFYINYFFDANIIINVSKIDLSRCVEEIKILPEYSMTGQKKYVKKPVILIPQNDFIVNNNGQNKLHKIINANPNNN